MLEILTDTDRRLVMALGNRKRRWTKLVLDHDAGRAWFERHGRLLPPRTLSVPLSEIAAIDAAGGTDRILLSIGGRHVRLTGEDAYSQVAAGRMRGFIGLEEAPPASRPAPRRPLSVPPRLGQAAAVTAACGVVIWLVAQSGGLVANAAAKAGGLVARSAERLQNAFLLPACDAPESRDAILELVRDRLGSSAMLADIAARGENGDERLCSATARRGTQIASVSYRNYWDGWTPKVRLTGEIVTLKLDAERTAAIAQAIDMIVSASRGAARSGNVPRQTEPSIDKALATVFGASDLAAEPLAPSEIDKALAWLKAADRVGAIYLLAGTGYDDFTQVPQSDAIQRRMRRNVVAFAEEFGRYADFQMVMLAALSNAQMRAATGASASRKASDVHGRGDEIRALLGQAMKSSLTALVYDGHNDGWRMARLTTIGRTAPVAVKFLSREDVDLVRDLALKTVDYFKDPAVRTRAREVAAQFAAP